MSHGSFIQREKMSRVNSQNYGCGGATSLARGKLASRQPFPYWHLKEYILMNLIPCVDIAISVYLFRQVKKLISKYANQV